MFRLIGEISPKNSIISKFYRITGFPECSRKRKEKWNIKWRKENLQLQGFRDLQCPITWKHKSPLVWQRERITHYKKQNYLKELIICNSRSGAQTNRVTIFTNATDERKSKTMSSKGNKKREKQFYKFAIYSVLLYLKIWLRFSRQTTACHHQEISSAIITLQRSLLWLKACLFLFSCRFCIVCLAHSSLFLNSQSFGQAKSIK